MTKKKEPFAAVAVVQNGKSWLLGLSTANDDRSNKWCFPGGHIKRGENPKTAAARECREETGITCRAVGEPIELPNRPGVVFVHCKANNKQKFNNNNEFVALGFFTTREMKSLKLYPNVTTLIDKFT